MELWNETVPARPVVNPILPPTVAIPSTTDIECQQMVNRVCVALEPRPLPAVPSCGCSGTLTCNDCKEQVMFMWDFLGDLFVEIEEGILDGLLSALFFVAPDSETGAFDEFEYETTRG